MYSIAFCEVVNENVGRAKGCIFFIVIVFFITFGSAKLFLLSVPILMLVISRILRWKLYLRVGSNGFVRYSRYQPHTRFTFRSHKLQYVYVI